MTQLSVTRRPVLNIDLGRSIDRKQTRHIIRRKRLSSRTPPVYFPLPFPLLSPPPSLPSLTQHNLGHFEPAPSTPCKPTVLMYGLFSSDRSIYPTHQNAISLLWVFLNAIVLTVQGIKTSSVAAGFGRHGMPPPASNPDL